MIKQISTVIFIVWSMLYILHDMKIMELFNMDIVPIPIIIILYMAILTNIKENIN